MLQSTIILKVALATPLRACFDYLPPEDVDINMLQPGVRLSVPFGRQKKIGMLVSIKDQTNVPRNKLKKAYALLDTKPLLSHLLLQLCQWVSSYYQHSLGDVIATAIPRLGRHGEPASYQPDDIYTIENIDFNTIRPTENQMALLSFLSKVGHGLSSMDIQAAGFNFRTLNALTRKGWVKTLRDPTNLPHTNHDDEITLNNAQENAVNAITSKQGFHSYLLDGITGSGKTEVYMQTITHCLNKQQSALVLVPEIGLTPQMVQRFQQRFSVPMVTLHSRMNDKERWQSWLKARHGNAKIIIGTRSAVFTPIANLGVIILDEEHDLSFKQQSGLRYSARDIAIMRAKFAHIPVVLGSATPSLESLNNVQRGRYHHLKLPHRAGNAKPPQFHLIDVRKKRLQSGLSPTLLTAIKKHLDADNQVLLFINRRGYAPTLLCHDCGWVASCPHCDSRLTFHQQPKQLLCHHCGTKRPPFTSCLQCKSKQLLTLGQGTERIAEFLTKQFPASELIRIDLDTTRAKNALHQVLDDIKEGHNQILVGTQMLAKGHHFPNVTLVAILDVDNALFSTDFRAIERVGQLITQVSGRAGRSEKPGEVYLQTHHPDHPTLLQLLQQGYAAFADTLLQERLETKLPPHSYIALLRAEAKNQYANQQFLKQVRDIAKKIQIDHLEGTINIHGPLPSNMHKKAGIYRSQLFIRADQRHCLQQWLTPFIEAIDAIKHPGVVRWTIDIDPQEL